MAEQEEFVFDEAIEDLGSLKGYMNRFPDSTVYPGAFTGNLVEQMYLGLGLAGEAGEAVDAIKKMARLGVPKNDEEDRVLDNMREKLFMELGDTLWYMAQIMRVYGWDLQEILQANIEKLEERRAKGEVKYR